MKNTAQDEDFIDKNPEELMKKYKKTKDIAIRNQLVLYYQDCVRKTVMSMRSILPRTMQYDEFVNQAVLALIDCIEKYDPDRGAKFETYIYKRLRGAVLSYLRKQSWIPYRVRAARRSILKEREALNSELMREPTNQELAERVGMTDEELDKVLNEISNAEMISFEELLETGNPVYGDISEPKAEDGGYQTPEGNVMQKELKQVLADAISTLPMRERQVITLCYYENLNLREIGEVLNISQQRASCARTTGLMKLNKKLSEYIKGKEENPC